MTADRFSAFERTCVFAVHLLTASGAALGLFALIAATRDEWPLMFLLLGFALIVDAIDGPLARRLNVVEVLPRWSGDVLDLVVDFTTYVFIPAYAVAASGLMPAPWSWAAGAVIAVTGALYFADRNMKTADNHFRGFPAVWNVIAFYLLLLRPAPWLAAATVAAFAVMTFLPIRFVHPFRAKRLRSLTVALLALWAVLAFVAVWQELAPPFWVDAGLCVLAIYFLLIGLWPQRTPPSRDRHA
jgi:phosphatidylcholine synthase